MYRDVAGQYPFLPGSPAYPAWRRAKLAAVAAADMEHVVEIGNPGALTAGERNELARRCARINFVRYHSGRGMSKPALAAFGRQLGLYRLDHNPYAGGDHISSIECSRRAGRSAYIPYTNRPLNWHTDGYYNPKSRTIHGFIMHCIRPARGGGHNELFDHEIVYMRLRDEDPGYIRALMHPRAMTIPANDDPNGARAARTGPVFAVDPDTGFLHMRFSARGRNIQWRRDAVTEAAVTRLKAVLDEPSTGKTRFRLQTGEGVICNNVLHKRDAFDDDESSPRLLYRARYYDRVIETATRDTNQCCG